jgi:hypothetical protein
VLATTFRSKSCSQATLRVSPVPRTYLGRFGRLHSAFWTTTNTLLCTLEAAKLVIAFIATRDRLSATKTEVFLASTAREEIVAPVIVTDLLLAIFTDEPLFALKTKGRLTLFTEEMIFARTIECRLAHFATVELSAVVAVRLIAFGTFEHIFALMAQCHLAIFAMAGIIALAADVVAALYAEEDAIIAL